MNTSTVRCRAIIVDNNEMLTVKHVGNEFVALPGGHLEPGESPVECVTREIIEELGIKPHVGRLLYINSYMDKAKSHSIEFFFAVTNASEFRNIIAENCSHFDEWEELHWISKNSPFKLLPQIVQADFNTSQIPNTPKFITN